MKNYFAHYAPVIMDLLGIKAWTKDSNQKILCWRSKNRNSRH